MAGRTGAPPIQVDEREFRAALRKLEDSTRDLTRAHRAVSARVAPLVGAATRRRTGRLAAGWKAGATVKAATVRNSVVYAGPQEWGWPIRGIAGTFATRDVIRGREAEIVEIYRAEIAAIVARVVG